MDMKNYIIYCTQRDSGVAEEFFMTLKKVCPPMGIRIGQPTVRTLQNDRTETFLRALGEDLGQGHQVQMVREWNHIQGFSCLGGWLGLVMGSICELYTQCVCCQLQVSISPQVICVLPNNRKDRYDAIKKFCCKDRAGNTL